MCISLLLLSDIGPDMNCCGRKRPKATDGDSILVQTSCNAKRPRVETGTVQNGIVNNNDVKLQPETLEDQNELQTIDKETEDIMYEFARLQRKIRIKIESKFKDKRKLIIVVKELKILSKDDVKHIDGAADILDVFLVIQKYWSILDYRCLVHIAESLCDDAEMKEVETYTANLENFCKNRIVNCPPECLKNDHQDDGRRNKIYVKLNLEILNVSVEDIKKFKRRLATILHCSVDDLILLSIEDGSILLTFMVGAAIGDTMFKKGSDSLSSEQQAALKRERVMSLQYNSVIIFYDLQKGLHPSQKGKFNSFLCA